MKSEWVKKPFDECICKIKTPNKIQKKRFLKEGAYPIVSQEADLVNGFWDSEEDKCKTHLPVVIFGDHTRTLKYVDFEFVVGADGVKILQPKPFIYAKYLFYYLIAFNFKSLGYSRHFKLLREISIVYPHINEQKRIVTILDDAFERIDTAITNIEKNLANAKELLSIYFKKAFDSRWPLKRLEDICENLDSRRIPVAKSERKLGDIPYYGASGVVDYVNDYIFNENILLVSEDGANLLARSYPIAFSVSGKSWVNNHAHVLKFKDILTQKYVEFYLNSISLEPYVSGMAQPKLNQRALNSIPIPLPELSVQKSMVLNITKIQELIHALETNYKTKTATLEKLKQSLLHKAFSGELTTDFNPDSLVN
jgi:type I restriction enzyme S subunit